jgi:hypothetical protein
MAIKLWTTLERSIRVVMPGLPALRAGLALGGEMFVARSHPGFAARFKIRRLRPLLEANRSFFLAGGAEAAWVSGNYTPRGAVWTWSGTLSACDTHPERQNKIPIIP